MKNPKTTEWGDNSRQVAMPINKTKLETKIITRLLQNHTKRTCDKKVRRQILKFNISVNANNFSTIPF